MSHEAAGARQIVVMHPLRAGFALILLVVAGALAFGAAPGARVMPSLRTLRRQVGAAPAGSVVPAHSLAARAQRTGRAGDRIVSAGPCLPARPAPLLRQVARDRARASAVPDAAPRTACRLAPPGRAPPAV